MFQLSNINELQWHGEIGIAVYFIGAMPIKQLGMRQSFCQFSSITFVLVINVSESRCLILSIRMASYRMSIGRHFISASCGTRQKDKLASREKRIKNRNVCILLKKLQYRMASERDAAVCLSSVYEGPSQAAFYASFTFGNLNHKCV